MTLWKGFQKPKRLEIDTETLTSTYGKFYAQPFERGFGTTVGNALRRVLLSSIEGTTLKPRTFAFRPKAVACWFWSPSSAVTR